ncbi:MAG: alpha-amylase [Chitinophagaceae bacterium]
MNQTLFQFFHWYYSTEGNLWKHAAEEASRLSEWGVTQVWLPPAYKSALGSEEPGYAVYDLYDLGEFDQKGSVRTRYGTKDEYLSAIQAFHDKNIKVLADIVLNHKHGGDEKEKVSIRRVKEDNRKVFTADPEATEAFTRFTFPGRNKKYSDFIWDQHSFTGVQLEDGIGMILNEYSNGQWEEMLEDELGNFDFLMGNDIEFRNPFVREELKKWGRWYVETTGIDGFRLDALKHISPDFYPEWLGHLKNQFKKDFLCIGEYWQDNLQALLKYIEITNAGIALFDVPLHHNFYRASLQKQDYDMRQIFDNTLVKERPGQAVTFVDNHDTQPLQSLESTVDFWFKPLANAIILLREQGLPCVFYASVYEGKYLDHKNGEEIYIELNKVPGIEEMMKVRARLAYGQQRDYFDHGNVVGWTREGYPEQPESGCAVLLSNGGEGEKKMSMGKANAGRKLRAIYGNRDEIIELDGEGEGLFKVNGLSASVWIARDNGIF